MYQQGEYVVYGIHGVCRILGTEKQLVNRKRTEYLVLEPLNRNAAKFYLPTQNPTAMEKLKEVLKREELEQLLQSDLARKDIWISEESLRKQQYRDLIAAGDRISLMQMVACLYRYKDAQEEAGRKFHQCDDNFLRDAERFLCSEICHVMGIPMEQARDYLRTQLR